MTQAVFRNMPRKSTHFRANCIVNGKEYDGQEYGGQEYDFRYELVSTLYHLLLLSISSTEGAGVYDGDNALHPVVGGVA
jgi:hypothetical protein